MGLLELCVREDLNESSPRAMGVLRPLKVVLENYPEGQVESLEVQNHPQKPEMGTRQVPFMRELYIEADDFMEDPPKGFFRLAPGKEVRLRSAYFIKCEKVIKDAAGNVVELRCTYDAATRGGNAPDGRKVKGTLHWVPGNAPTAEVRLYDRLFSVENPGADDEKDFTTFLNPSSLQVLRDARVEPMLADAAADSRFQFERQGYFYVDPKDSKPGKPVFNRTVTLKDSWVKEQAKGK
jgi:glutaminyl-tRNA synthetase